MLGDGHADARDDERGAGRHVDRAGAIAAGADHIDGVGRSFDAQHLGAHRRYRAGDLVDGFAAHAKRHQQSAHLRGRRLAGHHAVEGGCRFATRQCRAGGDFSDNGFEVVHRVLSGGSVIRARHLREGGLIDRDADLRFKLRDVLRDLFVGQSAVKGLLQFLDVVRRKVDRRYADVGDAEDDPLAGAGACGLSNAILGGAKRRSDRPGGHAGRGGIAPEAGDGFDFQSRICRLVGEVAALIELLNHLRRLGPQPAGDLVVAPFRLDLVLDLVKVAFVRRGDAQNVVPYIAATELDGIVVDAHIAGEGLRDDIQSARNVGHQLAAGLAAGAIDGVDGDGGQSQLLRGLDDTSATAALVLHFVAQLRNLCARTVGRNFFLKVCGEAFIGWLDPRLDFADLDQGNAEPAFYRLTDFAGRQRKGGVRNRGIDDPGFSDQAEVDVRWIEPALLGEILE